MLRSIFKNPAIMVFVELMKRHWLELIDKLINLGFINLSILFVNNVKK
jgi:hypothetical protein